MFFELLRRALKELYELLRGIDQAMLEESVKALRLEHAELEIAFLTIVLGPLVGVKTVPTYLSLELAEALRGELKFLFTRSMRGDDVLADLMSDLGVS